MLIANDSNPNVLSLRNGSLPLYGMGSKWHMLVIFCITIIFVLFLSQSQSALFPIGVAQ